MFFQFFLPSCLTVNLTLRSADYSTVYAYREHRHLSFLQGQSMNKTRENFLMLSPRQTSEPGIIEGNIIIGRHHIRYESY